MVLIGRNMAPDQIYLAQPRYLGRVCYYGEIVGNLFLASPWKSTIGPSYGPTCLVG